MCMHISSHCWVCLLFALNWPWDDCDALLWSVDSVKILLYTHTQTKKKPFLMLSISFAFCLYTVLCRSLHYTVYITTLTELCCLIFYKNALLKEVHLKDTFAAVDICARSSRAISIFLMARFACSNCLNDACALQFSSSVTDSQLEWDRGFDWSISTFNFLFFRFSNVHFASLFCWNTLSQMYF